MDSAVLEETVDNKESVTQGDRTKINREVKDTVFRDLFSDPRNTLDLYRTLHPEDTDVTIEDINITTIKNVLLRGLYNDLGFTVRGNLIIFMEAQSTWTVNIIVRIFMYYVETIKRQLNEAGADLYGSKAVEIARPEFYVLYTGDAKKAGQIDCLTLKDEFFGGEEQDLDVKVRVLTKVAPGSILGQYIAFTRILQEQLKQLGVTIDAVKRTIEDCIENNVLREYLMAHKKEVVDMYSFLFSQEEAVNMFGRSMQKEGKTEGEAGQLIRIVDHIAKENHISIAEACVFAGTTAEKYEAAKEYLEKMAAS